MSWNKPLPGQQIAKMTDVADAMRGLRGERKMANFDDVNVSPDMKRLQRLFIRQMAQQMQGYVDECDTTIPLKGGSTKIPLWAAVDIFNDFLLYSNGGEELTEDMKVKVT